MKKSVVAALAAAVVVGTSATTFAANPFSDVPPGHWSRDALQKVWDYGIFKGYGNDNADPRLNDSSYPVGPKFAGDRNITRYEMATVIARVMAKVEGMGSSGGNGNLSDKDMRDIRTILAQLQQEYEEELVALGVLSARVDELEKYNDRVIWQGKIEYTYKNHKTDNWYDKRRSGHHSTDGHTRVKQDDWIFRFEPIAVVNGVEDPNGKVTLSNGNPIKDEDGNLVPGQKTYKSLWTLRARIDAHVDLSRDTSTDFNLVRGWAQGDYNNFQIKVGRQPLYTNEDGIVWDTEYTGGEITFRNFAGGLRATIYGGRLQAGKVGGSIRHAGAWDGRQDGGTGEARFADAAGTVGKFGTDPSSFFGVNVQYDASKGLSGGAGYYSIKDDDFKGVATDFYGNDLVYYSNDGKTDKAQIWSVNAGYTLGKFKLWGAYAKNTKADVENKSWQALVRYGDLYGGGNQTTHKGQWAVWAGYKELGSNASLIAINWDDCYAGTKGFVAGASWAPMDRVVVLAKYFKGKYITGPGDAERLFGRVEFFF